MAWKLSRARWILLGVGCLASLLVLFALAVGFFLTGPILPPRAPSEAEREAAITTIERDVRTSFGQGLDSVHVDYVKDDFGHGYRFRFSLASAPVVLESQIPADAFVRSGSDWNTLLDNEAIGGDGRLVSLVESFHDDFPQERSMYYWEAQDWIAMVGGQPGDRFLRRALKGQPGPSVVVYRVNWIYASGDVETDPELKPLGVYTWDDDAKRWSLVFRGVVPSDADPDAK